MFPVDNHTFNIQHSTFKIVPYFCYVTDLLHPDHFLRFTATELQVPVEGLTAQTEFRGISTWSSLNALLFISRVNEETNVLISAADLAGCKTVGDIHRLITSRYHGTGQN